MSKSTFKCKTIENITPQLDVGDIWTELGSDAYPKFLILTDNSSFRIRLIGGTMKIKRHYVTPESSLDGVLSQGEILDLVRGDEKAYNLAVEKISSQLSPSLKSFMDKKLIYNQKFLMSEKYLSDNVLPPSLEAGDKKKLKHLETIDAIYSNKSWQNSIITNCLVREASDLSRNQMGEISLFVMNQNVLDGIFSSAISLKNSKEKASRLKISGLCAHDIIVTRTSVRNRSSAGHYNHTVNISQLQSFVSDTETNYLLREGIFDFSACLKWSNRKQAERGCGFFYRPCNKFKAANIMMQDVLDDVNALNDNKHIDFVEENINDLPLEAFDNDSKTDSVGSLEL